MIETHEGQPQSHEHRLPLSKMPKVLFALSAIGFCILLSEGAMADWTGVYLRQVLAAGPGTAAAGYAVFSAAMAIFRLLGDTITLWLGNVRTVQEPEAWWRRWDFPAHCWRRLRRGHCPDSPRQGRDFRSSFRWYSARAAELKM